METQMEKRIIITLILEDRLQKLHVEINDKVKQSELLLQWRHHGLQFYAQSKPDVGWTWRKHEHQFLHNPLWKSL